MFRELKKSMCCICVDCGGSIFVGSVQLKQAYVAVADLRVSYCRGS